MYLDKTGAYKVTLCIDNMLDIKWQFPFKKLRDLSSLNDEPAVFYTSEWRKQYTVYDSRFHKIPPAGFFSTTIFIFATPDKK
jgi:hypothetical protein